MDTKLNRRIISNADGLKINRFVTRMPVGHRVYLVSMFEKDNLVDIAPNGKYKKISIMGEARRANHYRGRKTNRYKHLVNGE
jgi:hypothetical protein